MGVTNHFLIGFEAHFMGWNSFLTQLKWPRTQNWMGHGPKGKPTTIALLKKHSNDMTSKRHTVYPWSSALLSTHQGSILLQQMVVSTETHNWTIPEVERLWQITECLH